MKYKYSLRTLMIAMLVLPPLLALGWFAYQYAVPPDQFTTMLALAFFLAVLPAVAIFGMVGLFLLILQFFNSELRTCPNCKKLVSKRGGFCPSCYCPLPPD
jgi:hypothetical protein